MYSRYKSLVFCGVDFSLLDVIHENQIFLDAYLQPYFFQTDAVMTSLIVFTQNPYVEVVTPSTSEWDFIWKQGGGSVIS